MAIQTLLLDWYDRNARDLPWRSDPQPYHILVSEFMLQQTRVETVLPYYKRFLETWDCLEMLASAEEQAVLRLWEGLGYYRRVLNLHRSAKVIQEHFGGQIPHKVKDLLELPGIGMYTAAAIASIAYGEPVAALDGNIRRVYARVFAVDGLLGEKETEERLSNIAEETLSRERPGDFNQALMDLGADICTPKQAKCAECPLISKCQAHRQGIVEKLPKRKAKSQVPHYVVTAAVIQQGETVLITQRAQEDLLGGMWEFPGGKLETSDSSLEEGLKREIMEELGVLVEVGEPFGVYKHAFTHFKITLHAFLAQLSEGETLSLPHSTPECKTYQWVTPEQLVNFPMGKVDRLIAKKCCLGRRIEGMNQYLFHIPVIMRKEEDHR